MAKITIDLEDFDLESLFEQGHEDMSSALTGTIVSEITRRVEVRIKKEVAKKIDARVGQIIDNAIMDKSRVVLKEFLSQPVNRTDRYGDTVAHYDSVYDMIKSEFDKITSRPVDSSGKPLPDGNCGYNSTTSLQYMIKNHIKKAADELGRRVTNDVDRKIKDAMTSQVQEALAKKYADIIQK